MKIEDIHQIEITISVIKQAQDQIKRYHDLREFPEIALIANDEILAKIKSEKRGRYTIDNPAPMYYTGELKNAMIDILITEKQKFLDAQIKSLENY